MLGVCALLVCVCVFMKRQNKYILAPNSSTNRQADPHVTQTLYEKILYTRQQQHRRRVNNTFVSS